MDKDELAVEFLKIYFNSHPGKIPENEDKAFELITNLHKKFKNKVIGDLKNKSERFVDNYFDKKDDKYL
jgi:hypothetical protein